MKVVVQRVSEASVTVAGEIVGEIGSGLLVLVCAEPGDSGETAAFLARKIAAMRIFEDDNGKMNRSVKDVEGAILAVSQFTLAAEWRKGNRPGFSGAAGPELGKAVYDEFCARLRDEEVHVETGAFGARMEVHLINSGPVTMILED